MEHMKPLIEALRTKLKQALILWAEGFREACCLHRVIVLCRRSKKLMIRTGQCFLLNGFIFLGSLFVLNSVVIPTLQWILPDHYSQTNCEAMSEFHGVFKFYSFLRGFLIQLFYYLAEEVDRKKRIPKRPTIVTVPCNNTIKLVIAAFSRATFVTAVIISLSPPFGRELRALCFIDITNSILYNKPYHVFWFYPLYVFSFILSNLWYNDIATHGFAAMGRSGPSTVESSKQNDTLTSDSKVHAARPAGLGGIMIGIGEQVYSLLLLTFFFFEVYAAGFIPYVGKALNFVLLSWMYAYYCFEYKWNFTEWGLEKRLDFFETNWAFFAGFGSPCVLAIFFFSPLVGYGFMAVLFPLVHLGPFSCSFGTEAEQVISTQRRRFTGAQLGKVPVFYAADTLLIRVLSLLPSESQERAQDNKTL
ncbi:Protein EI24 [Gossypium arboreum]|uniref:Protein EI24 n=1 Tax=Gossypium arboreum TaxID=29729 RepID=A0A0B0MRL5_GOSAR|nr:Protein EI24 [Gossypium arboreum]